MSSASAADWLIATLERHGVDTIFGIPGVHNLALYEALRRRPHLHNYLARHEQGAAFMADGYARASGKPGVALVTSGPGALNTLTPLGEAYTDSSPVLVVATNVERKLLETSRGTLHELRDQPGAFRAVIGSCERVLQGDDLPLALQRAWNVLTGARPRPAALDIPNDVLDDMVSEAPLHLPQPKPQTPAPERIQKAAAALRQARKPVILAGGGVAHGADHLLLALAERLHAPVVTTMKGKGVVPEDHPLSVGYLGSMAGPVAQFVRDSDVVLAAGTRLAGSAPSLWQPPCNQILIRIDGDPAELARTVTPTHALLGDAAVNLHALLDELGHEPLVATETRAIASTRQQARAAAREAAPWRCDVLEAVRAALPRDGILAVDMTMVAYSAGAAYPTYAPHTLLPPSGFGTLGFALPAAIGAKAAAPDRPVIALVGDGGLQFTMQEIATAIQYHLPVVILLVNDACFTAVKRGQQRRYGEITAVDLVNPDFQLLAAAYGMPAERVSAPQHLVDAIQRASQRSLPSLVEIMVPEGG